MVASRRVLGRSASCFGLLLLHVACVGQVGEATPSGPDAAVDAGPLDAGVDAGAPDASHTDASVDAGAPDASVMDASVDGGESPDAGAVDAGLPGCAPTDWCEDFEGPAADAGWFTEVTDDGGARVAAPPAGSSSPSRALRVEVERGRALLRLTHPERFFGDAGYHVFGRALVFGERLPAETENRRHGFVTLEGVSPAHRSYSQVGFRHDGGRRAFANFFVLTPWQDCWASSAAATPTPVGRWFCLEWEFDAAGRALRLWQDGALQVEAVGVGSGCTDGVATRPWVLPERPSLGLGLYTYDDVSLRAWVDDVVVSPARVGCR
jgi:hypothetical protein